MAFCIPRRPLSRRAALRGLVGGSVVTVGLPRLGAMLNGNGTAFAAGQPLPKRFGVWFWGNGIVPSRWIPSATGTGAAWELSEQLTPLAKVKPYLTVLTGYEPKFGGSTHRLGPAAALSGAPHNAAGNYSAATIDHVMSRLIGGDTAFRSVAVGVSRATANGSGQALNYTSSTGPNAPVAPEYDARAVFTRLFGKAPSGTTAKTPGVDLQAQRQRWVLDTVAEDARSLRARLGADDARRLDQHLDGIQQLEKRIADRASGGGVGPGCNLPADAASQYPAVVRDNSADVSDAQNQAMADLVTYALACDLTRVFLFQHGRPAAHYNMKIIGLDTSIHDNISHREGGDQPKMSRAVVYWMGQLRYLAERMQATPDGAGNLLDSSCVYCTSDVSFGRSHAVDDMPVLLLGRAGGALRGDQHHRAAKDNISKVLFTLLNMFGGNVTEFGSGGGRVASGIPEILRGA